MITSQRDKKRHVVGRAEEIPPGSTKLVPIGKFGVGVYNVNGEFYALANYCVHRGGPVCLGPRVAEYSGARPYDIRVTRDGEFVRCPWHGWDYEIKTGEAVAGGKRLRSYEVVVEDGFVVLVGV